MCAIAGVWMRSPASVHQMAQWASSMTQAMQHRGPDGSGLWVDQPLGLALAHCRLAIRDTGDGASQPMVEPGGDRVLVFNGEVDNHRSWREELIRQGHGLGHVRAGTDQIESSPGDTEALLHALSHWGPERVCRRTQGMWAWAWFERDAQRLTLSRDRVGKKPLYWLQADWGMAFASQMQAFRCLPMFKPSLNPQALSHYLRWGFISGPQTILNGVHRVEPGQTLVFEQGRLASQFQHWSVDEDIERGLRSRVVDPSFAQRELMRVLKQSVADRLSTDVSTGAFLSGGIDSALVVALMQELGASTRTWCAGFDDPQHDESQRALAIAKTLGTRHETVRVEGRAAVDLMPDLARIMDEPLADASLIPTTVLARQSASSVKVVLTGDGGDEGFGGYPRYRMNGRLMRGLGGIPPPLRRAMAMGLEQVESRHWAQLARYVPSAWRPTLPAAKADKLARWLRAEGDQARRQVGLMRWDPAMLWKAAPLESRDPQSTGGLSARTSASIGDLSPSEQLQRWEMTHYLSGDLLTKMDRATMWSSLEARSPLLDHRVVAFAWRCSPALKAEGPRLKELLRCCLEGYLPRSLMDVPKRGFTPPMDRWLRAELKAPALELLESLLKHTQGRWNEALIRQAWTAQQEGTRHEVDRVWTLLTLELWRQEWGLELP